MPLVKVPDDPNPEWMKITSLIVNCITMIICMFIARKIFLNLFGFKYCCCIVFRDKHNWIVSPSNLTRITALLALLLYTFSTGAALCFDILNLVDPDEKTLGLYAQIIAPGFKFLARDFYYFYMLSTLRSQLKREPLIVKMMPKNFLYIITIVIVSNIILWLICGTLFIGWSFKYFNGIDMSLFEIIYQSFHAFCDIFATLTLFVLYINGLNEMNKWYLSMQNDKFGGSQKMHEILILISRCSVICCVTMITNLILIICEFLKNYLFDQHEEYISVSNIIHTIIVNIDIIIYSTAIYMVFDFGYGVYRRFCGCCHEHLRKSCQNRHTKHIQTEYVLMTDIDESVDS